MSDRPDPRARLDQLPEELRALDRRLGQVRFEPRHSLGAEIAGRAARGELPARALARSSGLWSFLARHRVRTAVLAAGVAAVALAWPALWSSGPVTIDRCCYDLDGGGAADDGVRVRAQRDAAVEQLWIYEDLDHSGGLTDADVVRLERGGSPALAETGAAGLVTHEHCCIDFDGGGPADDGLLVIGVPPDRILMAAIYERGWSSSRVPARYPLR